MESKSAREYFQIFRGTPFTALLDDLMEIVIWRPLRSELARGGIVLHVSTWVGEEAKMRSISVAELFVGRVGSDTI